MIDERHHTAAEYDELERRAIHAAIVGDREIHSLRAELERLKKDREKK